MRRALTTLLSLSILLFLNACSSSGAKSAASQKRIYEQHVRNFAEGTPHATIQASWDALEAAGLDAFPVLIAHFNDKTRAAGAVFQGESKESPTVGDVCFDLVQYHIDGWWPKAFRAYYTLTPQNTQAWLDAHKGMTLPQMRLAANRESLDRAEAALAAEPSSRVLQDTVKYLKERRAVLEAHS